MFLKSSWARFAFRNSWFCTWHNVRSLIINPSLMTYFLVWYASPLEDHTHINLEGVTHINLEGVNCSDKPLPIAPHLFFSHSNSASSNSGNTNSDTPRSLGRDTIWISICWHSASSQPSQILRHCSFLSISVGIRKLGDIYGAFDVQNIIIKAQHRFMTVWSSIMIT